MIGVESLLGVHLKGLSTAKGVQKEKYVGLTVADRAALALRLDGARAGQNRTDDWIADHSPLLQEDKI